ncbi:hypothetical protein ZIOFF_074629 [Zingiber officinale]|uniref:Uncharacterized protein n=1 Tax=Zingiber officinale TaxID=94328 RepID=A0A8J5C0R6_ZINOF|nr:hypothetical protein ZIOFF_075877 [Zingiber officinale]KAG6467538.1 hypothetical protein ZIOFF_074629 [Zingiber officinale]
MEGGGKKPSSWSVADELFPAGKDVESSSSPGYFSTVFPPASAVVGKDSSQSDLYWTLSKPKMDGQAGNAQGVAPGGKSQSNPAKKQMMRNKDGEPVAPNPYEESAYFSSSVHYGGRDFYDSSASTQVSGSPKTYKDGNGENPNDSDAANRGEWWQGILQICQRVAAVHVAWDLVVEVFHSLVNCLSSLGSKPSPPAFIPTSTHSVLSHPVPLDGMASNRLRMYTARHARRHSPCEDAKSNPLSQQHDHDYALNPCSAPVILSSSSRKLDHSYADDQTELVLRYGTY